MRGVVWALAIGNEAEVAQDAYANVRLQIDIEEQEIANEAKEESQTNSALTLPPGWAKPTTSAPEGLGPLRTGGKPRMLASRHTFGGDRTSSIDADLVRMFPMMQHSWMQKTGSLCSNLRQMLQAFCYFRPEISYIQGMSYLGAVFLVFMPPERAFVCLVNLLQRDYFPSYMSMEAKTSRVRFEVFDAIFAANLPALFQKFSQACLLPDCYLMEWLLTLFSKQLPLHVVSRIWDNYFLHGEVYVFKVACGLLVLLEPRLLEKTPNECMRALRGAFPDYDETQVLAATAQVTLPPAVNLFFERRKTNPESCEFNPEP